MGRWLAMSLRCTFHPPLFGMIVPHTFSILIHKYIHIQMKNTCKKLYTDGKQLIVIQYSTDLKGFLLRVRVHYRIISHLALKGGASNRICTQGVGFLVKQGVDVLVKLLLLYRGPISSSANKAKHISAYRNIQEKYKAAHLAFRLVDGPETSSSSLSEEMTIG